MPKNAVASNHPVVVVFGRPGAGKTSTSEEAVRLLLDGCSPTSRANCMLLDLDICVPQWMRDNFAKGIYPTLQQRKTFIMNACQYVRDQIQASSEPCHAVIIAFSFVNTDMRITFKEHFPQSRWILVDTKKEVAHERILARKGHFYKVIEESNNAGDGKSSSESTNDKCIKQTNSDRDNIDNSEWEFQPVDFPHTVLDGDAPTSENASRIMEILKAQVDLMVENKKRRDMSNR